MRILHVSQPTDASGVPRIVADLVRDQVGRGHEVAVACPRAGQLAQEVVDLGATWRDWPATRSPGPTVPVETLRLSRIVRQLRPDLVHLHSSKAGLAGRLAVRGRVPTVFEPNAWSFEAVEGSVRSATVAWERIASRWTDLHVHVSQDEQRSGAEEGVRARRSLVVPNGVDLERWPPGTLDDRRLSRRRLGLPSGPLAVCIGRLARQKGQDLLLEAWPGVLEQVPAAHLVLVGDGPDGEALRRLDPPATTFAGARSDVRDWMLAADVVVVPSRWEGMALVPLEAMATTRSVVAYGVTGIAESVTEGAGAVLPPGDTVALQRALVERLRGDVDADAEGAIGRRHVENSHDARITAARLETAYRNLLAGAPAAGARPEGQRRRR